MKSERVNEVIRLINNIRIAAEGNDICVILNGAGNCPYFFGKICFVVIIF